MSLPKIVSSTPTPVQHVEPIPVQRVGNRPIYICWTNGVTEGEGAATVAGVQQVLELAGIWKEVAVFGPEDWADGDFGRANWYQDAAMFRPSRDMGEGPQVNAEQLFQLLRDEPWQKSRPHFDVMVLDRDLCTNDGLNFVFGVALPDFAYLQSIMRFREVQPLRLRHRLIQRLTAHEYGHVLGLPGRNGPGSNTEWNLGPHCTNICAMRQGTSVGIWIAQIEEEGISGVNLFCEQCSSRLRELTH